MNITSTLVQDWEIYISEVPRQDLELAADCFAARGFAVVPFLTTSDLGRAVAAELDQLIEKYGIRRDFTMAQTDGTPRRMRNVRQDQISLGSALLPTLYQSVALRSVLSRIVREPVHVCPYEPEQYVVTSLDASGDTHGWHWDDYAFALVWVAECPPICDGGFVQCVPRTSWDKADPAIYRQMASSVIHTVELHPGDLYLMRTDTTLHRVAPVEQGRRTIINMAFASSADLEGDNGHETMDTLWAQGGQE